MTPRPRFLGVNYQRAIAAIPNTLPRQDCFPPNNRENTLPRRFFRLCPAGPLRDAASKAPFRFLPRDDHFPHLKPHFDFLSHTKLLLGCKVRPAKGNVHGFDTSFVLQLFPHPTYPHRHAHDQTFPCTAFNPVHWSLWMLSLAGWVCCRSRHYTTNTASTIQSGESPNRPSPLIRYPDCFGFFFPHP